MDGHEADCLTFQPHLLISTVYLLMSIATKASGIDLLRYRNRCLIMTADAQCNLVFHDKDPPHKASHYRYKRTFVFGPQQNMAIAHTNRATNR